MPNKFGNIRVGCAGWSLPREQGDRFPTVGTHLSRYADRFPVVEINSSFYKPRTARRPMLAGQNPFLRTSHSHSRSPKSSATNVD